MLSISIAESDSIIEQPECDLDAAVDRVLPFSLDSHLSVLIADGVLLTPWLIPTDIRGLSFLRS